MTREAPPEGVAIQACLRELSGLLWRERVALDRLADALVAGRDDTVCDGLYRSISALELHRAISAREAALELLVDGDPTLIDLADAAPPGWSDVLQSHRRALVDLITEVGHLARRPIVDVRGRSADDVDLRGNGVRRLGVQRSLRDFVG